MATGILWHVFHTSGDPASDEYSSMAHRLEAQLEFLGERCEVVDMGPRNGLGWMGSCLRRAPLLLGSMIRNEDKAVGMLDADVELLKPMPAAWSFETHEYEFMSVDLGEQAPRQKRIPASVVAFRGQGGKKTLLEWAMLCQEDKGKSHALREQMYLLDAWEKSRPCTLFLNPREHHVPRQGAKPPWPSDAVLLHWPASRRLRGSERM